MIFFILPSLFTALELQSGSNRPQANAASGNAVITFFFTLFFFHAKHKCKVLSSARRYGNNGNGTKHWAEMFDFFSLLFLSITQNKMILSLDEFLFFFFFSILTPFWTFTNCIQEDIHIYLRGNRALESYSRRKLWKKTKSTPFFEKDPKQN